MDEMKIKLSTKFMKGIVSKLISSMIYKKFGYKVKVRIEDLDVDFINGETDIRTSVEIKLDSEEFKRIIKSTGLD